MKKIQFCLWLGKKFMGEKKIALEKDSSNIPRPIFGKCERKFIENITDYGMRIMKEARNKFHLINVQTYYGKSAKDVLRVRIYLMVLNLHYLLNERKICFYNFEVLAFLIKQILFIEITF